MNRFELFTMIFYVLDAEWDKAKNEVLGDCLSAANPFLFQDESSADPSIFADFCIQVPENVSIEESYDFAKKYVKSLGRQEITSAFDTINKREWEIGRMNMKRSE